MVFNLIPLGSGNKGKAPSCKTGWNEPANFDINNQIVKATKPPMYGVLTGTHNNNIVIDYDIYNVPNKNIDLASLKKYHGSGAYIVQTQSGGFHVYHKYHEKFEDWGGATGIEGYIDIRNTGNYVVGGKSPGYKEVSGNIGMLTEMPTEIFGFIDGCIKAKRKAKKKTSTKKTKTVKEMDEEVEKFLEGIDFSGICLDTCYDNKQNFDCDQKGEGTICPCCGGTHTNNNFFYTVSSKGVMLVKNYSEACKYKVLSDYDVVKHFFERMVCRIDDTLNYVVKDGEYNNLYTQSGILERFSHIKYEDAKGEHKFVKVWLDDEDKHSYRTMDFYPEDCPPDVFNTWVPFAASTLKEEGGSPEMFFELLTELTAGDPNDYAKKYLAFLVQKPNTKPTTCLVFTGAEGTGKGRMFYAVKKVFGRHLVTETSNPVQDVFGPNAEAYSQTKLVIMNESNATMNFGNGDRLKALISDEDGLKVNIKYIRPYGIRNLAGSWIAGNSKTLVNSGVSDRRFIIYETGEKFMQNEEYFGRFTEYIDDPRNQKAVYDALMAIDLTDFNLVRDRPTDTEAYKEAKEKCLPRLIKFLEHDIMVDMAYPVGTKFVELNEPGSNAYRCEVDLKAFDEDVGIKATEYCEKFIEWSGEDPKKYNAVKFGIAMKNIIKDHKIPQDVIWKKETKKGVVYLRNRAKAVDWLKKKNFTSREPLMYKELPE